MIEIKTVQPSGKYFFRVCFQDDTTLKLHQDTVFKHNLLNVKTLDEATLETLKADDVYHTLTQKALDLLAKKNQSRRGLYQALVPFGEPAPLHRVLDELEKNGYLDDAKALRQTVEEHLEFSMDGPVKIRHQLIKDGFDPIAVNEALSAFDASRQATKIQQLIHKTVRTAGGVTRQKLKERLMRALYTKGYEPEIFQPVLEEELRDTAIDEDALLDQRLDQLSSRYNLTDYKEKQKLTQKLMREGFAYSRIKSKL